MHGCNIIDNGKLAFQATAAQSSHVIIDATGNWWGTADSALIEQIIWHQHDAVGVPWVGYMPCATDSFDLGDPIPTDVDQPSADGLPHAFHLLQNYPNPFNASTTISFDLPAAEHVTLTVYNALGQRVATLLDERLSAGAHTVHWQTPQASSGVYFYRLETGPEAQTKKMVLLK